MPKLNFELATPADDADLRSLLRENPTAGSISLAFEREPCYFDASVIEGPFHQTIVARGSDSGNVIAVGNRSVRPLFVNGQVQAIGYLSQLRVEILSNIHHPLTQILRGQLQVGGWKIDLYSCACFAAQRLIKRLNP